MALCIVFRDATHIAHHLISLFLFLLGSLSITSVVCSFLRRPSLDILWTTQISMHGRR